MNIALIPSEWESIKSIVYSNANWESKLKTHTWRSLNRSHGELYPHFLSLIDLILTVPASTSDCEKGFSAMKKIKGDWRASLRTETLSDLMCVLLDKNCISTYDPQNALHLWAADKDRRPSDTRQGAEECRTIEPIDR